MISTTAGGTRLTLRRRPALGPARMLAGGVGLLLVLASATAFRTAPLAPALALVGAGLLVPLLWAARPGTTTVIDLRAGRLTTRSPFGRIEREERFGALEGVSTDRITLPAQRPGTAGLTVHRTLLLSEGRAIAVQGFGAPGPARALARDLSARLDEAGGITAAP